MTKKTLNHIQFLRAISVLLVFFYHLKLRYFEFGFVGVDIFFVISGFVISLIIYDEFSDTGRLNFFNFYVKRFKRIYPVLIFILSFSILLIIFFQPLDLFLNNLKVYFFSLVGISNLYYLFSKKDYFDNVFEDPFAHTWSLGIEEQFYLFFPIFIFIFLKKIKNIKKISYYLFFFIIIGIIITHFYQNNLKLIFYSPLFRFWEFLFGSLTFFLYKKINLKNNIFSLLTLIILILFILMPKNISQLNILLVVILLTSFFILTYENKKNIFLKIIVENKFIIFLGNISYSFYLWHLPIIYFYDLYIVKNVSHVPFLFLLIFLLSCFSYFYIESRFRNLNVKLKLDFKKIILSSGLVLLIIFINIITFSDSYNNKLKYKIKNLIYHLNYLEREINYTKRVVFYKINIGKNEIYRFCSESSKVYELDKNNLRIQCLKRGANNGRIIYVEGDSHTANYVPMFNEIMIPDAIYYNHKTSALNDFNFVQINKLLKYYKQVVYATSVENLDTLYKLIKIEKKFGKNVKFLILGAIPNVNNNTKPLKCLIQNISCEYSSDEDKQNRNLINIKFESEKLANYNPKFIYFDPYKAICPNKICKVFDKEKNLITHRDNSHLTIEGSILMKNEFMNFYKNFLSN